MRYAQEQIQGCKGKYSSRFESLGTNRFAVTHSNSLLSLYREQGHYRGRPANFDVLGKTVSRCVWGLWVDLDEYNLLHDMTQPWMTRLSRPAVQLVMSAAASSARAPAQVWRNHVPLLTWPTAAKVDSWDNVPTLKCCSPSRLSSDQSVFVRVMRGWWADWGGAEDFHTGKIGLILMLICWFGRKCCWCSLWSWQRADRHL